jgi:hypothetical protein
MSRDLLMVTQVGCERMDQSRKKRIKRNRICKFKCILIIAMIMISPVTDVTKGNMISIVKSFDQIPFTFHLYKFELK